MTVYAAVILCALLLSRMVYRYDMYDREPWLLLLAGALGYGAMWGVGYKRTGIVILSEAKDLALWSKGDSSLRSE